jgi:hypothetical protein
VLASDPSDAFEGPAETDWLIVPQWDRFQHYHDRNPPWIKLYTKLLSNPEFLNLTCAERGLLMTIWIAYASNSGRLTYKQLSTCCRARFGLPQVMSLNHAGFLHWSASTPLAPSTEKEKEKEIFSLEPKQTLRSRALDFAADWQGGSSEAFDHGLETLERELHQRLSTLERAKLWDEARERSKRRTE